MGAVLPCKLQDDGKEGLSLKGVAVMTKTAITPGTAKTVKTITVTSLSFVLLDDQKEAKMLSRTCHPLKLNPLFRHPEKMGVCCSTFRQVVRVGGS